MNALELQPLLHWWEADIVRYGLSYTPVRRRLTKVTGSHVVELTDRRYMMYLTYKLQQDRETQQKARIEMRKLRPTTIVPELRGTLRKVVPKPRWISPCVPKDHVDVKMCQQLPQLLFKDPTVEKENNNQVAAENNNRTKATNNEVAKVITIRSR